MTGALALLYAKANIIAKRPMTRAMIAMFLISALSAVNLLSLEYCLSLSTMPSAWALTGEKLLSIYSIVLGDVAELIYLSPVMSLALVVPNLIRSGSFV